MKKAVLLLSIVLTPFSTSFATGDPWEGTGTAESPYLIYDASDMQAIGSDPNYWDAYFKIMADIDLSAYTGTEFNIIGRYFEYNDPCNIPFRGVFDGNGRTISNFTYSSTGIDYVGLFGYVNDPDALITNLTLEEPIVDGGIPHYFVGALAGSLKYGAIKNCYSIGGSVSGGANIGGLIGECGGYATISNCYVTTEVSGAIIVGGLSGRNTGSISNCYATGSISGHDYVGGLVGWNESSGSIAYCYAIGSISGRDRVGGLVGENLYTIANCYATGSVSGIDRVGGLVGYNWGGVSISNCYSTGSVLGNDLVGGLVGDSSSNMIFSSFWDIETGGPDNGLGIPLPTAEMYEPVTFLDAGWDFAGETANGTDDIWTIQAGIDYPRFVWQYPLSAHLDLDNLWMYQNVLSSTNSRLTAAVLITDDPQSNSSYKYEWKIVLPSDVSVAPETVYGGGSGDEFWTFASPGCNESDGLSDSGQTFIIRVIITGADFGNIGIAEAEFGIALLGDANNDGVVNVADRAIINAFWRTGVAGDFTFRDCDINCDGFINIADRAIANAVWRGVLGQNSVTTPCPFR